MRYALTQALAAVFRQSQFRLDTCILYHETPICKIRQFTSRSRIVSLSQGINKTSLQRFTLRISAHNTGNYSEQDKEKEKLCEIRDPHTDAFEKASSGFFKK